MAQVDRCAPSAPVRRDLAWRHATESDLARITFTIDVSRWRTPPEMSNRAARVLRWYAAAHRCGKHGYVGTRASYAAIGAAIARATHEPASRSTVIRAVDELVSIGLLDRSRGRGDRVRQVGPGEYIREPLAVLTLTAAAREIWGGAEPVSHLSPQVSKSNGYNLPSQLPETGGFRGARPETTIEDASPTASAAPSYPNAESRTDDADPATAPAVAALVPRQSARPVAPLAMLADLERPEDGARQAAGQRLRFTSATRPTTRAAAVAVLLDTLARITRRTPIGAALCSRAAAEIAAGSPFPPSGLDWNYWIARWPELARGERDRLARTEILPLLRSSSGPPPRSSSRSSRSSPASSPPAAREPLPLRPTPRPPGGPPACPEEIAAELPELPDGADFLADVLARQLARLAGRAS